MDERQIVVEIRPPQHTIEANMQYEKKTLYQLQVNLTHSEINLSTVSEPSDMKPKLTKLTISVRL